jgi:hypothetical protein
MIKEHVLYFITSLALFSLYRDNDCSKEFEENTRKKYDGELQIKKKNR